MKSETNFQIIDEHKFPFSLLNEHRHGHCKFLTQTGDVTEQMDKIIGRSVFRIKGAVSANNYVEFDHLNLVGSIVYIQLCLLRPVIATIHMEIVTSHNVSMRLSLSTLYNGDSPKFLGRSLRLPLPTTPGWMIVKLDLNDILSRFCAVGANRTSPSLQSIKKIEVGSNMLLRDIVTSDKHISSDLRLLPKELAVKPLSSADPDLHWVDLVEHCSAVPVDPNLKSPDVAARSASKSKRVQKALQLAQESPPPAVNIAFGSKIHEPSLAASNHPPKADVTVDVPSDEAPKSSAALFTLRDLNESVASIAPQFPAAGKATRLKTSSVKKAAAPPKAAADPAPVGERPSSPPKSPYRGLQEGRETVLSQAMSSPRHTLKASQPFGASPAIVRYSVPEVTPSERLLSLERLLGYNGGPSVLLYDGRMLLLGTHSLLVIVDLEPEAASVPGNGLWKAFRSSAQVGAVDGFRQAILRGHSAQISIIEVADKENYMVTAEGVGADGGAGLLIVWDLVEGKKMATLRPHSDTLISAGFSADCSMLVTVGTDQQHRHQIIVWDLQAVLAEKGIIVGTAASSSVFTVARQISEFPVNRIRFSPFEDNALVSCGRENIRFWRIRKGHLPGRPVVLNEYSRGNSFTEMAFSLEAGASLKEGKKQVVYVSSAKGLLLRINCQNDQVLSAYQLHSSAIRSLCVHSGYAATGGDDCRLRVWPMDFSDFLLEAQHEGPVTNIRVSADGRKQAIGTATGTLGVLNVSEHSYNTILRSHIGPITQAVKRGPSWHEFATIGVDCTIRVWDVLSATQIIEFSSEKDEPLCLAYHPTEHLLACGFSSGFVRLFDVTSAEVLHELHAHTAAVTSLLFVSPTEGPVQLVSAGLDGNVVSHAVADSYVPIKNISFAPASSERVQLVVDSSHALIAVVSRTVGSLIVYETSTFATHIRLSSTFQSPAAVAAPGASPDPAATLSRSQSASGASSSAALAASSSQVVPSTPGADASVSLTSAVVGLFFSSDQPGSSLVLVTEKHLVNLPLHFRDEKASTRRVNRKSNPWDERSSRRIDFGVPTSVRKDEETGLVFLTARAPVTAPKKAAKPTPPNQLNKLCESANAFIIVDVRVQQSFGDQKLALSPVQVYQDLPGVVLDVCPCFEFERVVTVDSKGCIAFWEVKAQNLSNIAVPGSARKLEASRVSPSPSAGTPLRAEHQASTLAVTRDFELAVQSDPAMWSAMGDSAAKPARPAEERDEGTPESESAPVAPANQLSFDQLLAEASKYIAQPVEAVVSTVGISHPAYYQSMFLDDEEAAAAEGPEQTEDELITPYNPPVDSDRVTSDDDDDDQPEQEEPEAESVAEPLLMPTLSEMNDSDLAEGDDRNLSAQLSAEAAVGEPVWSADGVAALQGLSAWARLVPQQELSSDVRVPSDVVQGKALSQKNSVPPLYNATEGVLVTCDGCSIGLRYVSTGDSVLFKFPEPLQALNRGHRSSVVSTALSHSGVVLAAVVRVVNSDNSAAHILVVWCSVTVGNWRMNGVADLGINEAASEDTSSGRVLLGWSDLDSLVVVSAAKGIPKSATPVDRIRVTTVPASSILKGEIRDAVAVSSCLVNCPTCRTVSDFKFVPRRVSRGEWKESSLSLLITSQHKAFHLQLSNVNSAHLIGEILWSDDIGSRGPFLALDIATTSGDVVSSVKTASKKDTKAAVSRVVAALLDSFGAVKFVEFFTEEAGIPCRAVSVNIPAANINGTLHSLSLTASPSSSALTMALGGAHVIRVFSVQLKDLTVKTIAATMVLQYKVPAADFSPDFFLNLKPAAGTTAGPLLTMSAGGHAGIVSRDEKGPACYTVQSAPALSGDSGALAASANDSDLLAVINQKGHLSVLHSSSGVRLGSTNGFSTVGRLTCVEPVFATHFVVGTKCGRMAIFDGLTLELQESWALSSSSPVRSSVASSTTSLRSKPAGGVSTSADFAFGLKKAAAAVEEPDDATAVTQLSSLARGMALVALQRNNAVSIVQLYRVGGSVKAEVVTVAPAFEHSGPNLITDRLTHREQVQSVLVSCTGDDQMCGVLRAGTNILELHRTDHNEPDLRGVAARRKSYWTNVLNLSIKVSSAAETAHKDTSGQYDINIAVRACHVAFAGRELVIHVLGSDSANGRTVNLYSGTVSMPESSASSYSKASPLRAVLSKVIAFPEQLESFHFEDHLLAVATASTVVVFNLDASSDQRYGVLLRLPAKDVSVRASWANSKVTLTHSTEGGRQLIVHRQQIPGVFRFPIHSL